MGETPRGEVLPPGLGRPQDHGNLGLLRFRSIRLRNRYGGDLKYDSSVVVTYEFQAKPSVFSQQVLKEVLSHVSSDVANPRPVQGQHGLPRKAGFLQSHDVTCRFSFLPHPSDISQLNPVFRESWRPSGQWDVGSRIPLSQTFLPVDVVLRTTWLPDCYQTPEVVATGSDSPAASRLETVPRSGFDGKIAIRTDHCKAVLRSTRAPSPRRK